MPGGQSRPGSRRRRELSLAAAKVLPDLGEPSVQGGGRVRGSRAPGSCGLRGARELCGRLGQRVTQPTLTEFGVLAVENKLEDFPEKKPNCALTKKQWL
ncbi:hypothetical protein STEG23_030416, partial [Scotinomys teguina]